MSIAPEVLTAVNAAYDGYLKIVNAKQERFWNIDSNKDQLKRWLHSENIPVDQWISPHIWSAAFAACDALNLLESRPVPEKKWRPGEHIPFTNDVVLTREECKPSTTIQDFINRAAENRKRIEAMAPPETIHRSDGRIDHAATDRALTEWRAKFGKE
ncbi:MAG TPA: hypothetical protein VIH56_03235 [Candidatus Acidoferrales bacterium]